jgi:hypothetical protein
MRARPLAMAPIRAHRRALAALLLVLYLPACTSWQVGKTSPDQLFEDDPPEKVRVTQTDGSRVELLAPMITPDTLWGTVKGGDTVSIALSQVQKVEVRHFDGLKSLAVIFGILIGVWVAAVATWELGSE